jgi:hypothetical protein
MGPLGDWLTIQEASMLSEYHENYLRQLLRKRDIEGRKWGATWMVNRPSLEAYLIKAAIKGKPGPKPKKV